jgi:hypothetical protein
MAITKVNVTDSNVSSDKSYISNVVNNVFGSNIVANTRKVYDNLSNFEWQKNVAKETKDMSNVSDNTIISSTLDKLSSISDYAANLSSAATLVDKYVTNFMNFASNAGSYLSKGLSIFTSNMNLDSLMGTITDTIDLANNSFLEYYNAFNAAYNSYTSIVASGYNIYNSLKSAYAKIDAMSKWNSDKWKTSLKAGLYSGIASVLSELGLGDLSSCIAKNLYNSLSDELSNMSWTNASISKLSGLSYAYSGNTSDCLKGTLTNTTLAFGILYQEYQLISGVVTNLSSNSGYNYYAYNAYTGFIAKDPTSYNKGFNSAISSSTNINVSNSISVNSNIVLNITPDSTGNTKLDETIKLNIYNKYTDIEELIDRVTNIIENIYGKERTGSVRDFILNLDKDDQFDTTNPLVAILDVIIACITIDVNWNKDEIGNINYYKMIGSSKLLAAFENYLNSKSLDLENYLFNVKDMDVLEDIACTIQFEEPTELVITSNINKVSAPSVNF